VGVGPTADGADLARLAAKARVVESLSSGDVRVLAAELRADLERLVGASGGVVSLAGHKTRSRS
jgi:hypothetical protein